MVFMYRSLIAGLVLSASNFGLAEALDLPEGAELSGERTEVAQVQGFPTAPFSPDGTEFLDASGEVVHRAFQIKNSQTSPHSLMSVLKQQLGGQEYDILFECNQKRCGGFDFRYELDLLPEPQMHVDLGDYRYLLARNENQSTIAIVTSRAPDAGFIHITTVTPTSAGTAPITLSETPVSEQKSQNIQIGSSASELVNKLLKQGHVPLDDLVFPSGATEMESNSVASLSELSEFLKSNPDATLTLVGHSDTKGSAEGNKALSRKRANSVLVALVDVYGVKRSQLAAEGIGFLAPRATNASEQGRAKNRRVEAVLTSTPVE